MSIVKTGSNNNQDVKAKYEDQLRRLRDEYIKRENDMIKKHNKEIRRVSESYQNEISTIKENGIAQQKEFAERAKTALNMKDAHYAKEMNELKKFNRDQVTKLRSDSNRRFQLTRDSAAKEKKALKQNHTSRFREMKNHYNKVLKENERINNQRISTVLDNQTKAMGRQREKLGTAHGKELKSLQDFSAEQKSQMQRAYDDLRQSASLRSKAQNIRHLADKQRISEAHMEQSRNQDIEATQQTKVRQEGFQESLKEIRNDFIVKDRENRKSQQLSKQELEERTNRRIQDTIQRLSNKINSLRAQNTRDEVSRKRIADKEIKGIKRGFQANVENYAANQQKIVEDMNAQRARDIREIKSEQSQILGKSTKFYQRKMEVQDFKSKEALANMVGDFKSRNLQQKEQAENRIEIIRADAMKNQDVLKTHNQNKIDLLRKTNEKEKLDIALNLTDQKNKAIERSKEQLREQERVHQSKMQKITAAFNKKLAELHERQTTEKAKMRYKSKSGVDSLKRVHNQELESTKIRYEQKLAQTNSSHDKEVDRLNKQHQEQLDELLATFRKA